MQCHLFDMTLDSPEKTQVLKARSLAPNQKDELSYLFLYQGQNIYQGSLSYNYVSKSYFNQMLDVYGFPTDRKLQRGKL